MESFLGDGVLGCVERSVGGFFVDGAVEAGG